MSKFGFIYEKELARLQDKESLIDRLLSANEIIVYGAGNAGVYTKFLLNRAGFDVTYYVDKSPSSKYIGATPVKSLSEITEGTFADFAVGIIAVGNYKAQNEIKQLMTNFGISCIYNYIELFNETFLNFKGDRAINYQSYLAQCDQEAIENAYSLLTDSSSKEIFEGFIKGHFVGDNNLFAKPDGSEKYFPEFAMQNIDFTRVVDCGAFVAEFSKNIVSKNFKIDKQILIEADFHNFKSLKAVVKEEEYENAQLINKATSNKNGLIGFRQSGTAGSFIDASSETMVEGITLDSICVGFFPTVIKMDIEGAEYDTLLGAKETIIECMPSLLISIYHKVEDIWRIPLLLNSWGVKYKYTLRAHNYLGMSTVLYATKCE